MSALSLREIEDTLKHSDPRKRQETLRAVTDLFLSDAPALDENRVQIFDDVFGCLLDGPQSPELVQLSERMAPIGNAPKRLVGRLARDSDISIAGPVLRRSPRLTPDDLCEIASTKGNAHMLAMAARSDLTEPVTDILVHDGDQQVARAVAGNHLAKLSGSGMDRLFERAESDQSINASLSTRPGLTPDIMKAALAKAAVRAEQNGRAVAAAIRLALSLKQENRLGEERIAAFANCREYENLVAALAVKTTLNYEVIENLMHSHRIPGVVLVCKSLSLSWATVDAVLGLARFRNGVTKTEIDQAHREFVDLSRSTAERIVRFWHLRQSIT